jgi:hypothetical protein
MFGCGRRPRCFLLFSFFYRDHLPNCRGCIFFIAADSISPFPAARRRGFRRMLGEIDVSRAGVGGKFPNRYGFGFSDLI